MKVPVRSIALLVALIAGLAVAQQGYRPPSGLVPTEETAVEIATAVFKPIYGAETIASERPFHASLQSGVWYVSGTLPPNFRGGTAKAAIAQKDGRILGVWHDK